MLLTEFTSNQFFNPSFCLMIFSVVGEKSGIWMCWRASTSPTWPEHTHTHTQTSMCGLSSLTLVGEQREGKTTGVWVCICVCVCVWVSMPVCKWVCACGKIKRDTLSNSVKPGGFSLQNFWMSEGQSQHFQQKQCWLGCVYQVGYTQHLLFYCVDWCVLRTAIDFFWSHKTQIFKRQKYKYHCSGQRDKEIKFLRI